MSDDEAESYCQCSCIDTSSRNLQSDANFALNQLAKKLFGTKSEQSNVIVEELQCDQEHQVEGALNTVNLAANLAILDTEQVDVAAELTKLTEETADDLVVQAEEAMEWPEKLTEPADDEEGTSFIASDGDCVQVASQEEEEVSELVKDEAKLAIASGDVAVEVNNSGECHLEEPHQLANVIIDDRKVESVLYATETVKSSEDEQVALTENDGLPKLSKRGKLVRQDLIALGQVASAGASILFNQVDVALDGIETFVVPLNDQLELALQDGAIQLKQSLDNLKDEWLKGGAQFAKDSMQLSRDVSHLLSRVANITRDSCTSLVTGSTKLWNSFFQVTNDLANKISHAFNDDDQLENQEDSYSMLQSDEIIQYGHSTLKKAIANVAVIFGPTEQSSVVQLSSWPQCTGLNEWPLSGRNHSNGG